MNGPTRPFLLSGNRGMPGVVSLPEAESQSATIRGDFVKLVEDSGDSYTPKVTTIADNSTDKIYGLLLQGASGTEDTALLVQPLVPGVRFVMCVNGTSHDYAVGCAFEIETSTYHCIDSDKSSNNTLDSGGTDGKMSVVVIGLYDANSTAYGRYICEVRDGFHQYNQPA